MDDDHFRLARSPRPTRILSRSAALAGAVSLVLVPPNPAVAQEAPHEAKPEVASEGTDKKPIPHYNDGFVVVPSMDPVEQPFRLKIKHVSQLKYTNSKHVDDTYTDHLGVQREVVKRNDIQLTRDVFYFSGYAFDPKLDFNILIFFSSATLVATAAGYVGYRFHEAFNFRAGYFSLPSTRAMTGTYPFFHGTDRSMTVNYFRPGFTQGIWGEGQPLPGFRYIAMIGNSLNNLDVLATHLDQTFAGAATVWYDLNDFGVPWNDYEDHDKPAVRVGTAFTYAREDRLSDLSNTSPENAQTFISDGNLLFATGALAPDVTIRLADHYLWAIDLGVKFRGLAFNTEFFQRWLNRFRADGPLPVDSLYDWGFEASLGYFVVRSQLELYGRTSLVKGAYETPFEVGGGFNWYPFNTRQVWFNVEAIGIKDSPYGGGYYVYSVGQTGLLLQSQLLVRF